jgi:hypothetical protein
MVIALERRPKRKISAAISGRGQLTLLPHTLRTKVDTHGVDVAASASTSHAPHEDGALLAEQFELIAWASKRLHVGE